MQRWEVSSGRRSCRKSVSLSPFFRICHRNYEGKVPGSRFKDSDCRVTVCYLAFRTSSMASGFTKLEVSPGS